MKRLGIVEESGKREVEIGGDQFTSIGFFLLHEIKYNIMNVIHVVICSFKHHTFFVIFCCVCNFVCKNLR